MREVDEADDAVHHGIAQRDQRINAAQRQAVDDLLKEDIHVLAVAFSEKLGSGPEFSVCACGFLTALFWQRFSRWQKNGASLRVPPCTCVCVNTIRACCS